MIPTSKHVAIAVDARTTYLALGETPLDAKLALLQGWREHLTKYAEGGNPPDVQDILTVELEVGQCARNGIRMTAPEPAVPDTHIVCELICQKPSVSVHPTASAALEHAVQCAMENMPKPGHDEAGWRTCFRETLGQYEHICDGDDYEIYILTPTNQ